MLNNPLKLLKLKAQIYIDLNQYQVHKWINSFNRANSKIIFFWNIEDLLNTYNNFPWYKRWWQRLTLPITQLETYYYAIQFSDLDETSYLANIFLLEKANNSLSWFSPLKSWILPAKRYCQQLLKSSNELSPIILESYNPSKDSLVLIKSITNETPFLLVKDFFPTEDELYLSEGALRACEKLGINRNQSITWSMIRNAYKELTRAKHPDKNRHNEIDAGRQFVEIKESYQFIQQYIANPMVFYGENLADLQEHYKERERRSQYEEEKRRKEMEKIKREQIILDEKINNSRAKFKAFCKEMSNSFVVMSNSIKECQLEQQKIRQSANDLEQLNKKNAEEIAILKNAYNSLMESNEKKSAKKKKVEINQDVFFHTPFPMSN